MGLVTERQVTSLVVFLIATALLSQTFGQSYSGLGAFSPMFFPQIILSFWALVAAMDLIMEVCQRKEVERPRVLRVVAIAVFTMVFLFVMTRLGFFLSAVPFAIATLVILGLRSPLPILALGIGVPAVLVALFNHLLILPLPTSPFTWWF